jgi:hypothetical protein
VLTGGKDGPEIPVKEFVSIVLWCGGGDEVLGHFHDLLGDDFV